MKNLYPETYRHILLAKTDIKREFYRRCRNSKCRDEIAFAIDFFFLFQTTLASCTVKTRSIRLDMVASFLLCKASKEIGAIAHLCKFALEQDAAALLRNLSELLVSLICLCEERDESSLQRYLDFDEVNSAKKRNSARERTNNDNYPSYAADNDSLSTEKAQEDKETLDKYKMKYGKNTTNWYGQTFSGFAESCNAAEPFVVAFSIYSDMTHSSLAGARFFRQPTTPGRFAFSIDPDFKESTRVLLLSLSLIYQTISRVYLSLGPAGRGLMSIVYATQDQLLSFFQQNNVIGVDPKNRTPHEA